MNGGLTGLEQHFWVNHPFKALVHLNKVDMPFRPFKIHLTFLTVPPENVEESRAVYSQSLACHIKVIIHSDNQ